MNRGKFKTTFAERIFKQKYALTQEETWDECCRRVVEDVCGSRWGKERPLLSKEDRDQLFEYMVDMKFIPAGRFLSYAGREAHFWNNCYVGIAREDTREEWARFAHNAMSVLTTGGGFGGEYSIFRPSGRTLKRTGGVSSGPIPLMKAINEIGRNVQQGGSRRSALWAGLNWQHEDINEYLRIKDWTDLIKQCKLEDFNFPAPLDMTNVSVQFDTEFANRVYVGLDKKLEEDKLPKLWYDSVLQMCKTGEPGHAYNFWTSEAEIGRNPCAEFISDRDNDVCCLGSINLGNIETLSEFTDVVAFGSKFLVSATVRAELPYYDVVKTREQYRKIGLGLMGVHEWLLQRNKGYEVDEELRDWLQVYREYSERSAVETASNLFISNPIRFRAIAPAGTIGILASTTTGIEPLFAVAYKRRYLTFGTKWKHEYIIDATAQRILDETGGRADDIETAYKLSSSLEGVERRVKFQAEVQDYVDMGISSTINLASWGDESNNNDTCFRIAAIFAKYAPRLRGLTCYPNGSRGGQPLTEVSYVEARKHRGQIFDEEGVKGCSSGSCGI